ncbi:hypothetical protein H4W80_004702 [Nonomuraea angiospora]|uniref:Uncharacterized protein n=1 Tax=Nonomuraea angiospora TaxID=46172 RepID=A0ABR9M0M1_9ACTN|nr:hypothetical protein [Nonomuraea angiospora]
MGGEHPGDIGHHGSPSACDCCSRAPERAVV